MHGILHIPCVKNNTHVATCVLLCTIFSLKQFTLNYTKNYRTRVLLPIVVRIVFVDLVIDFGALNKYFCHSNVNNHLCIERWAIEANNSWCQQEN